MVQKKTNCSQFSITELRNFFFLNLKALIYLPKKFTFRLNPVLNVFFALFILTGICFKFILLATSRIRVVNNFLFFLSEISGLIVNCFIGTYNRNYT